MWENKHQESGEPYDMRVITSSEGKVTKEKYIEVKTTQSDQEVIPGYLFNTRV